MTLYPKDSKPDAGANTAGPVGWWKFDETGGITAANAAGNKLTGKLHGQPRWTPDAGARGGALELDGQLDWVEFADTPDLDVRGGLSVAVWLKTRGNRPGGTLLAKGDAWRLQRTGAKGHVEFSLTGPQVNKKGKAPSVAFKAPMNADEWHHLVGVYDGKSVAIYVDGEEKDRVAAAGAISVNNVPVTLGENAMNRSRLFAGWLDDARLYTRGLSVEEVKTLFREGGPAMGASK